MPGNRWPSPWQADRVERAPDKVALLIPGHAYTVERPLLYFAQEVFARHGWTTQQVWWPEPPPPRGQDLAAWFAQLRSFVHVHVQPFLERETAPTIALVGKSMAAYAAAMAADRSLPGIWLTPVLRDPAQVEDLRRGTAPFLLVGGTADAAWDPETARSFGRPFHEAPDADHSLEIRDDPVKSVEVLRQATIAMDAFVRTSLP